MQDEVSALNGIGALVSPVPGQAAGVGGTVHAIVAIVVIAIDGAPNGRAGVGAVEAAKVAEIDGHIQPHPIVDPETIEIVCLFGFELDGTRGREVWRVRGIGQGDPRAESERAGDHP